MKTKNNYRVTTLFPKGALSTIEVEAWGISWVPNEVEKNLNVNLPLDAEIIKIEKL